VIFIFIIIIFFFFFFYYYYYYYYYYSAPVASVSGSTAAYRLIVRARLWKLPLVSPGVPTPTTGETSGRER
jgi:hypothetical protein